LKGQDVRYIGSLLLGSLVLVAAPDAQAPAVQAPASQLPAPDTPATGEAEKGPAPRPVGTMSQLMIDVIYPTSDAVFYVATRTPATGPEWTAFQSQTLMLAESANLLMMPGRARDQDQWMKDSKLLLDVGMAAYKAARAKDVEALSALNEQLYVSCTTCHMHYRPNYGRRRQQQPSPQSPPGPGQ
jgi:hypothetical protein